MMDDLISRQAAIDAIYHHIPLVSIARANIILNEVPSAQPEPCEDAVSREWLISKLRNRKALFCKNQIEFKLLPEKDKARVDEIDAWIGEVLNAPSAQPERKKGKWIDDCTCSKCLWVHEDSNGFALITNYNFCPNCGADMRGDDT